MRKLIVQTFLTLDGVMQAPGGPEEDASGGFTHGGWLVNYWNEQADQVMGEATSNPFAMVLGRRTYDIMAAFWPDAPEEAGGQIYNEATKYVASRSQPTLAWSNSVLIEGNPADGLADLKEQDGPELVSWQRESDPDVVASRPHRRVPPLDSSSRRRIGEAPLRRRHHPRWARAGRWPDIQHRSRDGHVPVRRRDRHRDVRVGLTTDDSGTATIERCVSPPGM